MGSPYAQMGLTSIGTSDMAMTSKEFFQKDFGVREVRDEELEVLKWRVTLKKDVQNVESGSRCIRRCQDIFSLP